MFERCALAQWRGYDQTTRDVMTSEFKLRGGAPGIVGNAGHHLYTIWRVDGPRQSCSPADILMSIKVDFGPDLTNTKNLIVVG